VEGEGGGRVLDRGGSESVCVYHQDRPAKIRYPIHLRARQDRTKKTVRNCT